MIDSIDISVIMQGPVYGNKNDIEEKQITKRCCIRVKELLPKCELILSTWEDTDTSNIDVDKIIFNKDPGGVMMYLNGVRRMNNTNRMIVSTVNGIRHATRKYVLKLRTDNYIENLSFLSKFDLFKITESSSILKARIISLSANHPIRGAGIIFMISDWVEFGYREDVMKLWEIPIQENSSLTFHKGVCDWDVNLVGEAYIWPQFLKKDEQFNSYLKHFNGPIPLNKDTIQMSEYALAKYIVLYEGVQLGINSLKYWNKNYVRRDFARAACYMHYEWEQLYKKYYDNKFHVKIKIRERSCVLFYNFVFKYLQPNFYNIYQILKKTYNKQ